MNAFNHESGYFVEMKENGYAIISHENGQQVYFTENYRKALSKCNKFNKRSY